MAHIPFGYKIVDGRAAIDEEQVTQLKIIYTSYLDGKGLVESAKAAGIDSCHGSVGRMLDNKKYLGTDYYPQLIDAGTFAKVQEERKRRATALGRTDLIKEKEEEPLPYVFHFNMPKKEFKDPYAQAAYIYSLIESEG